MKSPSPNRPTARTPQSGQKTRSGRWAKERKALNLRGRAAFKHWPAPNRFFFACACGSLAVGTLSLIGPPLASQAEAAFFPYTAEGKRQTCLSNLAILARAFEMYAQDNDGHMPEVGYAGYRTGTNRTWVTVVRSYASTAGSSRSVWVCPTGPGVSESETCAYGLNPVLAGAPVPEGQASTTLLLSDRGSLHNLRLVPLAPGWELPSASAEDMKSATNGGRDPHLATNIAFRHEERAGALFADGHAGMLSPQDAQSLRLWGGPAVMEGGVRRLASRDAESYSLVRALKKGDVKGSTDLLLRSKSLPPTLRDLQALWMLNWLPGLHGEPSSLASPSLDTIGWHLARALERTGSKAMRRTLESETKRRADEEHGRVAAASWIQVPGDNGIRSELPPAWEVSQTTEGRLHTTYARSSLPGLWCSIERGDRLTYTSATPVDWRGSEKRLQAKYRTGYKRLKMERTVLLGRPAGLWEYELEKSGGPRLRKRFIGATDALDTYVFSVTAPANCFSSWDGDFDRILQSLTTG